MSYSWTPYPAPNFSGYIPILAGGLINTLSTTQGPPGALHIVTMTTTGTVTTTTDVVGPESPQFPGLNAITDGTSIFAQYRSNFPRTWLYSWSISGLTFTENLTGVPTVVTGFVYTGGTSAVVVGKDNNTNVPAVASNDLSSLIVTGYNDFPSYSGELGFAVFDGTDVWAVLIGTSNLFQINASTLAVTAVHTLPSTISFAAQIGFDGTYIYISDGSTIIVWDTATSAHSTHGSVGSSHCYYSANLGVCVIAEDVTGGANFYTMPAGGGTVSASFGNATTITGNSIDVEAAGMCDGPAGNDLWVSVSDSGGDTWNLVWRPSTMKIIGVV